MLQTKKGKKLYACFVDFKKAFDSIWHEGLFRKLENKRINGNFLALIKNIYSNTMCAVKINDKTTNFFKYEKGVQQGNPLSPLLFNLYINDIFESITNKDPVSLDDSYFLNGLMYADDLIILSTTTKGLQDSLDLLNNYCYKWKLKINYAKTKSISFTKGTQKEKHNFSIDNKIIENVKEFKYLGITVNRKNCSFTPTLADLSCKANRAQYAIFSKVPVKKVSIKTMLRLFDTCIAPILLYGSEIWAPYMECNYTKWEYTPIEKTHTQFIKRLLGVNRSTTNILVRGETGRNPLMAPILTRNINFNYELTKKDNRLSIINLMQKHENGLKQNLKEHEEILSTSKDKLRKAVYEEFNTLWQSQIPLYPKATTYNLFKNRIKFENYLMNTKNRKLRVTYTKFRLSDHNLFIEEGRRKRPPVARENRICHICSLEVEDEIHFLTTCSKYESRQHFFNHILTVIPSFNSLQNESKFIYLMSQENNTITEYLVSQIYNMFEERDKLLHTS